MKRTMLALVALLVAFTVAADAQTPKGQTKIVGEVIDIISYVGNGMKPDNADRKAVAEANAKAGNPLGILERSTGKIYIVAMQQTNTSPVATLSPYFGLRIFAVGKVYKRGGVNLFLLSDIGKSVK